jgi:formyltetrahydrofolate deformylase
MLYAHGANILHADQHRDHDLGLFFMRVEWSLDDAALPAGFDLDKFRIDFTELARELEMHWHLSSSIGAVLLAVSPLHGRPFVSLAHG